MEEFRNFSGDIPDFAQKAFRLKLFTLLKIECVFVQDEWVSMGRITDESRPYGVEPNLMFSFPVTIGPDRCDTIERRCFILSCRPFQRFVWCSSRLTRSHPCGCSQESDDRAWPGDQRRGARAHGDDDQGAGRGAQCRHRSVRRVTPCSKSVTFSVLEPATPRPNSNSHQTSRTMVYHVVS